MAFRRDSKVDAFQRQISALRHQLGGEADQLGDAAFERYPENRPEPGYHDDRSDFHPHGQERRPVLRDSSALLFETSLPVPEVPAVPSMDNETSVIAHTTAWSGSLESTGSLHVYGRVEGSLTARDDIFVAEEADVDAVIVAARVTIAGKVHGSIHCTDRFEILPHGRVAADVQAPAIVIHDGAVLTGDVTMATGAAGGDVRAKLAPLAAARG